MVVQTGTARRRKLCPCNARCLQGNASSQDDRGKISTSGGSKGQRRRRRQSSHFILIIFRRHA